MSQFHQKRISKWILLPIKNSKIFHLSKRLKAFTVLSFKILISILEIDFEIKIERSFIPNDFKIKLYEK